MMKDLAKRLRELADELEEEAHSEIPAELEEAVHGEVYDVEAEGWGVVTDYVIAFNQEDLNVDSRNVGGLAELEEYAVKYFSWGDDTRTNAPVELCVSSVEGE